MKAWSHENKPDGKDEWLTPKWITDKLGPFDLDPCSPVVRPWDTAKKYYTIADSGLLKPWNGFVWCNPPYNDIKAWMARMVEHNNGIALTFARTDTAYWHEYVFPKASALFFLRGRLSFHHVDGTTGGTAGAASVLIAYGPEARGRLGRHAIDNGKGWFVIPKGM